MIRVGSAVTALAPGGNRHEQGLTARAAGLVGGALLVAQRASGKWCSSSTALAEALAGRRAAAATAAPSLRPQERSAVDINCRQRPVTQTSSSRSRRSAFVSEESSGQYAATLPLRVEPWWSHPSQQRPRGSLAASQNNPGRGPPLPFAVMARRARRSRGGAGRGAGRCLGPFTDSINTERKGAAGRTGVSIYRACVSTRYSLGGADKRLLACK